MKLCFIVPGFYPGAGATAPYEYTKNLAALGIDVTILAFGCESEPAYATHPHRTIHRIQLQEKPSFSPGTSYRFVQRTLALVAQQPYDLVHVYAFRGCGLLPILGRRYATRWLLDIRTGNIAKSRLRVKLANWGTRLESRSYSHLMAIDRQVGEAVLGSTRPFFLAPLGADMDKFRPSEAAPLRAKLGIAPGRVIVAYAGSLNPSRLPERILYAFARAHQQMPGLHLLMMGDGVALEELKRLAGQLQVSSAVDFLGYVPYHQIQEYMAAADIGFAYVPRTLQFDYQPPLKTIECLACGLPTIATDTGGNRQYIRHGENGLLAEDTPEALGAALAQPAGDPHLRQKLAEQARPSVLVHDWRRIVTDQLLPAYRDILCLQSDSVPMR
jgi:glycosyltransferase involved in cell wall biosynthesis